MGRGAGNHNHQQHHSSSSSSSSSAASSSKSHHHRQYENKVMMRKGLSTDLRLGRPEEVLMEEDDKINGSGATNLFVKVYMEGIPIGRKLNLLAYESYEDMIRTLDHMFATNILWDEILEGEKQVQYHVLTYEDKEGDWLIVGDVPWEMFVSCVKRLKITRADGL